MCSVGAGGGGLCDCKGKCQRGGETRIFNRVASKIKVLKKWEAETHIQNMYADSYMQSKKIAWRKYLMLKAL